MPYFSITVKHLTGSRTQQVVVEGQSSEEMKVLSGLPQGSVLGLLLFLIYIDEVGTILLSQESELVIFADDVLLYKSISKSNEFLDTNHLILNPSKCKYMAITTKSQPMSPEPLLTPNGHSLSSVDKYLGVLLNKNLSCLPHIDLTCSHMLSVILAVEVGHGQVHYDTC